MVRVEVLEALEDVDARVRGALHLLAQLAHVVVDELLILRGGVAEGVLDEPQKVRDAYAPRVAIVEELEDELHGLLGDVHASVAHGLRECVPVQLPRRVHVRLVEDAPEVGLPEARPVEALQLPAELLQEGLAAAAADDVVVVGVARGVLAEAHEAAVVDVLAVAALVAGVDRHAQLAVVQVQPQLLHAAPELARRHAPLPAAVHGLEGGLELAPHVGGRLAQPLQLALEGA